MKVTGLLSASGRSMVVEKPLVSMMPPPLLERMSRPLESPVASWGMSADSRNVPPLVRIRRP